MDHNRQNDLRSRRSREPLDRRLDQWIETGRQFVDGVSGTRPGKRKLGNSSRLYGDRLDKVGRWVGDKLDWLLEDEEDWLEPWEQDLKENQSGRKRPLEAISRRVPQSISAGSESNQKSSSEDDWADESLYRIDRWARSNSDENNQLKTVPNMQRPSPRLERRPLPRSNRRRN